MYVKVELCALLFRLAGNVGTIDTSTWGGGSCRTEALPPKRNYRTQIQGLT